MAHLSGRHVLITGGSSGIGEALALRAAREGADLTLIARGEERLGAVAATAATLLAERAATGPGGATAVAGGGRAGSVGAVACDVADRDAVVGAIRAAEDERGPVDVLVCSAGITLPGRFLDADDDTFRAMVDVDYFGTLWPIRAVAPGMARRGEGSIVGVASAAALVGVYGYSAYGAAKFAVRGLLESLRTELAPHGVHVGCVYPPDVDTPMLAAEEAHKPPETKAISGAIAPISAERVAAAIVRGIERREPEIFADAQTRALARTVALAPGAYRRLFDRRVRRAGGAAPDPPHRPTP